METEINLQPLSRTHERRLLKLIEFLEKLPRKKFDFSQVVADGKRNGHYCATVACAGGWLPAVFPRLVKWTDDKDALYALTYEGYPTSMETVAGLIFGTGRETAIRLLNPGRQAGVHQSLPILGNKATPKQVAKMLRAYLKLTKTNQK